MTVIEFVFNGGGIFVNTPHVPPFMVSFVTTLLVKPAMGLKVNWNILPATSGNGVMTGASGTSTTRLAGALVMAPQAFVMITP